MLLTKFQMCAHRYIDDGPIVSQMITQFIICLYRRATKQSTKNSLVIVGQGRSKIAAISQYHDQHFMTLNSEISASHNSNEVLKCSG